ncbi:hypothetical protein D5400_09915 [Georhizobium profundi]|uniref:Uncharacterized protein n=1 Tax=Georhizobium profundi TaxID=2341112 RepID=A0A3Q8XNT1_9HYPH|nr:hypothetical protein D5400_09915 [Georhizobium profundi]
MEAWCAAACEGEDADDITFANLEYVATNDIGGVWSKKAILLAFTLFVMTVRRLLLAVDMKFRRPRRHVQPRLNGIGLGGNH